MAQERQQQRSPQGDGRRRQPQEQQSSRQSTQAIQRRGGGRQTGLARRQGDMPSMFSMDPFDMLRTSPFALMRRLSEDLDQYFSQLGLGRGGQGMAEADSGPFLPPVEVFERDGNLVVRVDLPGMTKDDVRVEINENVLTIEGERRSEHEEQQEGIIRSERIYGRFRRQLLLPEGVNADQATANFKDGVLEISMPAPQQAQGRQIDIHSEAASPREPQAASGTES